MCGICFGVRTTPPVTNPVSPLSKSAHEVPTPAANGHAECDLSFRREAVLLGSGCDALPVWDALIESVKSRGPDYSNSLVKSVDSRQRSFEMRFHASILHMRGDEMTPQPFTAPNGDVFLFNGEIFDGLEVSPHENDGQKLFSAILQSGPAEAFFSILQKIEGPYAFVYYQASTSRIYFARDPLGRRSLVLHYPTARSPYLYLSSCTAGTEYGLSEWKEVECDLVHCLELKELEKGQSCLEEATKGLVSFPRLPKVMGTSPEVLIYPFDRINPSLPSPTSLLPINSSTSEPHITSELHSIIQAFLLSLEHAVSRRVLTIPFRHSSSRARVAILFSGGIDCSTLALIVDRVLPNGETVDLINVAFENPRVLKAAKERPGIHGRKQRRRDERGKTGAQESAEEVQTGDPPIDIPTPAESDDPAKYDVPDRITGRASWRELCQISPSRDWQFVEVNVPYEEMQEHRQRVVELMRPAATVMDLSISIAFYFAAKGRGMLASESDGPRMVAYTSEARVLLSGLGADELLGGYARHRRAFDRPTPDDGSSGGDWKALIEELQMDLDRISNRNLGRDDRIISCHGKEARYPFLAGNVVELLCKTEVWLKMDMRFKEGLGDKLLLRLLARELGLSGAAQLKKRAIHFGARTAKMDLASGRDRGDALLE